MKNVYAYIVALLLCYGSFAQELQNANWYFGQNGGLSFLPPNTTNPVPLSGGVISSSQYSASVSDQSGNLLFYLDDNKVRNKFHGIMSNGSGLLTSNLVSQGAIIVPKPGTSDSYYIVTISGIGGGMQGLHYSEVNMGLSGGLGDVVTATKNTVLKDYLGANVGSTYGNLSNKLTSAKHADGINYWIVTQLKNRVHVYLASASGISFCCSTIAPVNIVNNPSIPNSQNSALGQMKISPDQQRIGICYSSDGTSMDDGAVAVGSFDNSSGSITFDPLIYVPGAGLFFGLEFSPDSQIVYFANYATVYSTTGASAPVNTVYSYNSTGPFVSGLQLAINNKIYVSQVASTSVSHINNPDNISSPNFQYMSTPISGVSGACFPQWVWRHNNDPCESLYLTTVPEMYNFYNQKYGITAYDNYVVEQRVTVIMRAQGYVQLNENVHIKPGANFLATYGSCLIEPRRNMSDKYQAGETDPALNAKDNSLLIYPNPSDHLINIYLPDGITRIGVISYDGKIVLDKVMEKTENYSFDVSSFAKGIYMMSITDSNGKHYTEKIIVK